MENMTIEQCTAIRDVLYSKGPVTKVVLKYIQESDVHVLTLNTVAAKMRMSRGTLCRRLREEGTNYQQLQDSEISHRAMRLMSLPGSNVAAVSAELGYAEPVCFRRAFRRWFGITPSQYRQSLCC